MTNQPPDVEIAQGRPIPLTSSLCQRPDIVGLKAATLAKLAAAGFCIPNGWCLSVRLHAAIRADGYQKANLPDLTSAFSSLLDSSSSKKLIVRSSGSAEDGTAGLFPGMFRSVPNVATYDDLRAAIVTCMKSAESESVKSYCVLHGVDPSSLHVGVLVQEQLEPSYSGVAFTSTAVEGRSHDVLVELTDGKSNRLLAGAAVKGAFAVTCGQHPPLVRSLTSTLGTPLLEGIVQQVGQLSKKVEAFFKSPQDIEWAYTGSQPWLVQSRPLPTKGAAVRQTATRSVRIPMESQPEILPGESEIGLKGAAMMLFVKQRLFTQPTVFLPPRGDFAAFSKRVELTEFGNSGVTARFSFRDEIGLPRFFAQDRSSILSLIEQSWEPSWLGIVHSYMDVVRSFELYLADDHWVLEHVPGVWESDSTVSPDVLIARGQHVQGLLMGEPRRVKLLSPRGRTDIVSPPEARSALVDWQNRLRPLLPELRAHLATSLPLNIHFVADGNDAWQFLNIRRTKPIGQDFSQRGHFHVVSDADDLESWDGNKQLLIAVAVQRGEEASIVRIVSALPADVRKVYVAFGVMSHPAIVLREQGIETIPAYSSHEIFQIGEGDKH